VTVPICAICDNKARVETFARWEDLERLRAEWDTFNDQCGGDVFGSFQWCRTWWEFYGKGRELDVRVVRRGADLVAIFRFFREKQWLAGLPVRFVRLVGCDFGVEAGRIAIAPSAEDEAVRALAESMGKDWDVIHLGPFGGFVDIKPEFVTAFEKHLPGTDVRFYDNVSPHAVFDLPGSFEEFLKQAEKRQRSEILRSARLLAKSHKVEHRVRATKEELEEALPGFFESHERLWREKGLRGYFNEWPDAKAFHGRLVEVLPDGKVFMSELSADGAAVAQHYGFRSRDIVHSFQPTRQETPEWKKLGVGNIGFFRMVEHAIASGAKMVDAGGPPIDYKLKLGGRLAPKWLLTITGRSTGVKARLRAWKGAAWLLDKAYGSLWYRRVAPRIGMTGSPFSRTWVRSRLVLPG